MSTLALGVPVPTARSPILSPQWVGGCVHAEGTSFKAEQRPPDTGAAFSRAAGPWELSPICTVIHDQASIMACSLGKQGTPSVHLTARGPWALAEPGCSWPCSQASRAALMGMSV